MSWPSWIGAWVADLGRAGVAALAVGGLVVVVILVVLARRVRMSSVATLALVGIVTGTTVDGAIAFARDVLHTQGVETLFPAVVFEALAVSTYAKARAYARLHGGPGPWAGRLYLLGVLAGAIVATAAGTLGAVLFRALMPVMAVRLLVWELTPDDAGRREGTVSWRWTPRRIGVRLGLVDPGEADLEQVNREHRVRALTQTAHRVHHGKPTAKRPRARLRRLALLCDDAMVAEARRRLRRVHDIEALTNPDTPLTQVDTHRPVAAIEDGHTTVVPTDALWPFEADPTTSGRGRESVATVATWTDTPRSSGSGPVTAGCGQPSGHGADNPVDTGATVPAAPVDFEPANEADTPVDTRADIDQVTERPKPRVRRSVSTADRIARLRRRNPDITVPALADRLEVSPRTVRRHLSAIEADTPDDARPDTTRLNGATVKAATTTE